MKQYLKALREYEKSNYRFEQLCQYLSQRNSSLIKQYRDGAINLPSFIMIKKLHNKYFTLCAQDNELNNLFIILMASIFTSSCAVKSGYYTQKGDKWYFLSRDNDDQNTIMKIFNRYVKFIDN